MKAKRPKATKAKRPKAKGPKATKAKGPKAKGPKATKAKGPKATKAKRPKAKGPKATIKEPEVMVRRSEIMEFLARMSRRTIEPAFKTTLVPQHGKSIAREHERSIVPEFERTIEPEFERTNGHTVIAVIGDVVASRRVQSPFRMHSHLRRALDSIRDHNPSIASPYTLTLGDEFQAVYKSPEGLFHDLWCILAAMYPVRVRFSIGVGRLTTGVNPMDALRMDGPAFHQAREGLDFLKKGSRRIQHPLLFGIFYLEHTDVCHLFNDVLVLISQLCAEWKSNRWRVMMGLLHRHSRRRIASDMGVSSVAVHKNIRAGELMTILGICDGIELALKKLLVVQ